MVFVLVVGAVEILFLALQYFQACSFCRVIAVSSQAILHPVQLFLKAANRVGDTPLVVVAAIERAEVLSRIALYQDVMTGVVPYGGVERDPFYLRACRM